MNEVTDIDGWNIPGRQHITLLGGYLGQIMIILNAIVKEFPHLDRPAGAKNKSNPRAS